MPIKKVTPHPTQNEALIFERSQTGRVGYRLPKLDVEETAVDELLPAELRRDDDLADVPEVSEVDVVRHFTRMSTWNYSIDLGMYPLGSCTLKYNSRLNEKVARMGGYANLHPLAPAEESQGALELIYKLQEELADRQTARRVAERQRRRRSPTRPRAGYRHSSRQPPQPAGAITAISTAIGGCTRRVW